MGHKIGGSGHKPYTKPMHHSATGQAHTKPMHHSAIDHACTKPGHHSGNHSNGNGVGNHSNDGGMDGDMLELVMMMMMMSGGGMGGMDPFGMMDMGSLLNPLGDSDDDSSGDDEFDYLDGLIDPMGMIGGGGGSDMMMMLMMMSMLKGGPASRAAA